MVRTSRDGQAGRHLIKQRGQDTSENGVQRAATRCRWERKYSAGDAGCVSRNHSPCEFESAYFMGNLRWRYWQQASVPLPSPPLSPLIPSSPLSGQGSHAGCRGAVGIVVVAARCRKASCSHCLHSTAQQLTNHIEQDITLAMLT